MAHATRQAEIAVEQAHVDRVYTRLDVLRAEAEQAHRDGHGLARARTPGSLVERDAMVFHAARRLRALDAEYEGLVFGRLDLTDGEVRHIGRLGLRDPEHEPLVIDWRAPGAAGFYQATAEEPMGVVRRRVIQCQGPKVVDISDDLLDISALDSDAATDGGGTDGDAADGGVTGGGAAGLPVVGDGALLASLARAKGERMRDIVTTIQREQDEAIRAPAAGVTLIEGGPGTGKTAVALHRAAHLLYRDRRRFEGGGVLLVGPSSAFMSYVERVLPSLGEETAELRALGEIVDGVRSDRLDLPALAALKGSARMLGLLRRSVRAAPPGVPAELKIVYAAEVLRVRSADLDKVRRDLHARVRHPNTAGGEVRRALLHALWARRPAGAAWNTKRFAEEVSDRDEFEAFARAWWPALAPVAVLGWLGDPEHVRRSAGDWLTPRQCQALAASWAGAPGDLSVADVALVDELRVMLGEPRPAEGSRRSRVGGGGGESSAQERVRELSTVAERYFAPRERAPRLDNYDGYAHVLVDEAQDLSPMQWRMLGRRGRQASWTIVGDAAQSAWPDPAEARRARDDALRGKQLRRFHLTTNYRNSAEIFEFAADVVRRFVPDADLPVPVRRTGLAPVHRDAGPGEASLGDAGPGEAGLGEESLGRAVVGAVIELLDAVEGSVGVLTPAARREAISARLDASAAGPRVQVLDGMRAKGMEYDAVVVVAPDEIAAESPAGVRVLYVALTRATHRLVTVANGDWYARVVGAPDTSGSPVRDVAGP